MAGQSPADRTIQKRRQASLQWTENAEKNEGQAAVHRKMQQGRPASLWRTGQCRREGRPVSSGQNNAEEQVGQSPADRKMQKRMKARLQCTERCSGEGRPLSSGQINAEEKAGQSPADRTMQKEQVGQS